MSRNVTDLIVAMAVILAMALVVFLVNGCASTSSRDLAAAQAQAGGCACITSKCESTIALSGVAARDDVSRATSRAVEMTKSQQEQSDQTTKRGR